MAIQPVIRDETHSDASAIETVTIAAFENAPHTSHTEHIIVRALRAADALTVSLVAESDDEVIGHVAISPVSISDGSVGWYGLGPVSVLPERQGMAVGSELIRAALSRLRDIGAAGCVVLGEPSYYARFGFQVNNRLVVPGVPAEYFQVLPFASHVPMGNVAYHSAFNVTG